MHDAIDPFLVTIDNNYDLILFIAGILYLYFMFYWGQDEQKTWFFNNIARNFFVKKVFIFFGFRHKWNFFQNPPQVNKNLYCEIVYENENRKIINLYNGFGRNARIKFLDRIENNQYIVKLVEHISRYNELDLVPRYNLAIYLKKLHEAKQGIKIKEIYIYEYIFSINTYLNKSKTQFNGDIYRHQIFPMKKDRIKLSQ